MLTNGVNGKQYIGQTTVTPDARWQGHVRESQKARRNHLPLYSAMRKYGVSVFALSVLDTATSQAELNCKEQEFIFAYSTNHREFGYNLHAGGNVPPRMTPETAKKVGDSHRGKPKSALHRQHVSEALKKIGYKTSVRLMGHETSVETRIKIGAAHKGKVVSEVTKDKLRVARVLQAPIRWTDEQKRSLSAYRKLNPAKSQFQKGHAFYPKKTGAV
jgi:group I intron endonuclease